MEGLVSQVQFLAALVEAQGEELCVLRAAQKDHRQRPPKPLLSQRNIAWELHIRRSKVADLVKEGRLKAVPGSGTQPRYLRADVERLKSEGVGTTRLSALRGRPVGPARPRRATAQPLLLEPIESMLARAKVQRQRARPAS